MFCFYLLAFAFLAPFRDTEQNSEGGPSLICDTSDTYAALLSDENHDPRSADLEGTLNGSREDGDSELMSTSSTTLRNRQTESRLSESIFVPIKDTSSGSFHDEDVTHTCNHSETVRSIGDESSSEEESSVRSVRFNKMAEVREMSPLDAPDALMARLSYSASMRMRRQKSHHKTARTALMFAVLVSLTSRVKLQLVLTFPFPVVCRQLLVPVGFGAQ